MAYVTRYRLGMSQTGEIVVDTDPRSVYLYAPKGTVVDEHEADRMNLEQAECAIDEAEPVPVVEVQALAPDPAAERQVMQQRQAKRRKASR